MSFEKLYWSSRNGCACCGGGLFGLSNFKEEKMIKVQNVLEIALGSLVAVIAIGLLSEKNNWFNSKLQRYTGAN